MNRRTGSIAAFLCLGLLMAGIWTGVGYAGETEQINPALDSLAEPVVVEDASMPGGLRAEWNCIYFGSYPSCEIVGQEFGAVDSYAVKDGDVLADPQLYEQLSLLGEEDWEANEAVLDGRKYRRMKAADAQSWASDRPQHYAWDGEDIWHYFRYEPVRWRIIERNGDTAMLLSDRELDCAPYNTQAVDVYWKDSTLRSFLNGYGADSNAQKIRYDEKPQDSFYGSAFSEEEKACIIKSTVENPVNPYYGTDCGEDTEDYVFLLSGADVYASSAASRHGFREGGGVDDPARRFKPTMYAMARGTWYSPVEPYKGNGFWFMRTNGYTASCATYICDFGYIYGRGTFVTCNDSGLLPVIVIDLSKASFEEAGIVSSADIIRPEE